MSLTTLEVSELEESRNLDWRRIRHYIAKGEIEVFRDALLSATFDPSDAMNPVVVFRYDLLNKGGYETVGAVERQYGIYNPEEISEFAIDIKRLGFAIPEKIDAIPLVVDQIDFASLLVEVMIRDSSTRDKSEATLVRRYPCGS